MGRDSRRAGRAPREGLASRSSALSQPAGSNWSFWKTASWSRSVVSNLLRDRSWAAQPTSIDNAVAKAAPATPKPKPATRTTSPTTLNNAAQPHARNGAVASPRAIDAACAVCHISCKGMAAPRMRQYVVAGARTAAVRPVT